MNPNLEQDGEDLARGFEQALVDSRFDLRKAVIDHISGDNYLVTLSDRETREERTYEVSRAQLTLPGL